MQQKASLQNTSCQYVHRAEIDLPKAMLEVKELRKKVRLAEKAAISANRRATNEPTPRSNKQLNPSSDAVIRWRSTC